MISTSRPQLVTAGTGHPRLHVSQGGHLFAGQLPTGPVRLRGEVTRVGSDPAADLVLAGLSPRHLEIRRDADDEYVARALEGTFTVNGVGRPVATLHTGDLLRAGEHALSFARDESVDHQPQPHFTVLDRTDGGWLDRWERLLFRLSGPGIATRRH